MWRRVLAKKNLAYLRKMANKGYDVDRIVNPKVGNTGLHYAAKMAMPGVVEVLLQAGALEQLHFIMLQERETLELQNY